MNGSAAVRGLFQLSGAGSAFRDGDTGEGHAPPCGLHLRAEAIRTILSWSGRTVTQLSEATGRHYGTRSSYFIPPTFLFKLRSGITPHICQIVSLSESTGYRFFDWLRMFGFDLHQVPRLQVRLHPERTVLITPVDNAEPFAKPPSYPHEAVWNSDAHGGAQAGDWRSSQRFLFAKIGASDALLDARLRPGSIVRVDRDFGRRIRGQDQGLTGNLLWLVEQASGLTCCRIRWIDERQIVLLPSRSPWGLWPLRLPTEARILGMVDLDASPPQAETSFGPPKPKSIFSVPRRTEGMRFSELLHISRARSGLTFRAAHRLTHAIAQMLNNPEYAIALGLLSDYEAMGRLPRHIAKILSLCIVYCMDIRELMAAAGVIIDDAKKLPLPMLDPSFLVRPDLVQPELVQPDLARQHFMNQPTAVGGVLSSFAQSAGG